MNRPTEEKDIFASELKSPMAEKIINNYNAQDYHQTSIKRLIEDMSGKEIAQLMTELNAETIRLDKLKSQIQQARQKIHAALLPKSDQYDLDDLL